MRASETCRSPTKGRMHPAVLVGRAISAHSLTLIIGTEMTGVKSSKHLLRLPVEKHGSLMGFRLGQRIVRCVIIAGEVASKILGVGLARRWTTVFAGTQRLWADHPIILWTPATRDRGRHAAVCCLQRRRYCPAGLLHYGRLTLNRPASDVRRRASAKVRSRRERSD